MFYRKRTQEFSPEYLSIRGVAQVLGISERTAHSLVHDKEDPIPSFRIGTRLIRVRKDDLHGWMARRREEISEVDRIVEDVLGAPKRSKAVPCRRDREGKR